MRHKFNLGDKVKYVGKNTTFKNINFDIVEVKIINFKNILYVIKEKGVTWGWEVAEDKLEAIE